VANETPVAVPAPLVDGEFVPNRVEDVAMSMSIEREWEQHPPTVKSWEQLRYYERKGVTVCERWHVYANFVADMGERPEGKILGRFQATGNFEPGNCAWMGKTVVPKRSKVRNRRTGRKYSRGMPLTKSELEWLTAWIEYQKVSLHADVGRRYKRIFLEWKAGKTLTEIAKKHRASRQLVDQIVRSVDKRLSDVSLRQRQITVGYVGQWETMWYFDGTPNYSVFKEEHGPGAEEVSLPQGQK
jgi:hypothetical protein